MGPVRILHAGGVGEYKAGEVVSNPHPGLIFMAENETKNAADGNLLCEFVDDDPQDVEELREQAKELGIKGFANMKAETLRARIEQAQNGGKEGE